VEAREWRHWGLVGWTMAALAAASGVAFQVVLRRLAGSFSGPALLASGVQVALWTGLALWSRRRAQGPAAPELASG
jgi:hypothetical protein